MSEIQTDTSHPGMIRAIENNLFEFAKLFRVLDGAIFHQTSAITYLVLPNTRDIYFSGVWRIHLSPDQVENVLTDIVDFFEQNGRRPIWWITPSCEPPELFAHFETNGHKLESFPGMALNLKMLPSLPPMPLNFTITRVKSAEELTTALDILSSVFYFRRSVTQAFYSTFLPVGFDDSALLRHYIGWLDGTPVATASMMLGGGVAGIYNVAVLEEARRQGIGTSITLQPFIEAHELGYQIGVLNATEAGYSIYAKIGFQEYCKILLYVLPEK